MTGVDVWIDALATFASRVAQNAQAVPLQVRDREIANGCEVFMPCHDLVAADRASSQALEDYVTAMCEGMLGYARTARSCANEYTAAREAATGAITALLGARPEVKPTELFHGPVTVVPPAPPAQEGK